MGHKIYGIFLHATADNPVQLEQKTLNKMFKVVLLFVCANLILLNIDAQNSLAKKIKYADSVLIVSYKTPSPIRFNNNKDSLSDEIIFRGKLNTPVLKERRSLSVWQRNK